MDTRPQRRGGAAGPSRRRRAGRPHLHGCRHRGRSALRRARHAAAADAGRWRHAHGPWRGTQALAHPWRPQAQRAAHGPGHGQRDARAGTFRRTDCRPQEPGRDQRRHGMSKRILFKAVLAATALFAGLACAQGAFPTKPITLVVPNPPGGLVDTSARLVADPLQKVLKQTVVVDNRGGGSGNVAYGMVARAPADGYTLLISYSAYHVGNPALTPKLPWTQKDFTPIALVTVATNVIAVHPSVPAGSLQEFIAYLKNNPGRLSYAS